MTQHRDQIHHCTFETVIGWCGIVWGERGVRGVQLAEDSASRTAARIARRFPGSTQSEPPDAVGSAIEGIRALLAGEARDLTNVILDMSEIQAFHRSVYEIARAIPPGRVSSYGEIARQLGDPQAAQAVGQALGSNPFALIVPCHRVVAAGGKLGGFSAHGGRMTKRRLLEIEKARSTELPDLFDLADQAPGSTR